jgi:type II secretory pathway predicted ATPase ExeA
VSAELYTEFFGFTERPFTLLPDPDFLFWSNAHKRAFAVLEYGIVTRAPLTVVTGEVGTGKTTLIQRLLRSLDDTTTIGLISNAQGGRGELLRWVLNALDVAVPTDADYVAMFQAFQDFVIGEYAEGRHTVLVIDEAQNLSVEALEELRMLTNINSNKDELLQLILVGQPELREVITRPSLRQFAQRVTATYHIDPFDAAMTEAYIHHRLRHAGGTGQEFAADAIATIYAETGGIPRLVNKLCDLALVYAASDGLTVITAATVAELLSDGLFLNTRSSDPFFLTSRVAEPPTDSSREAAE